MREQALTTTAPRGANGRPLTTFKRTRIVLQEGESVLPMVALSTSADGGLIVDLSKSAPTKSYRYGIVDVPAGEGPLSALVRHDAVSRSVNLAPKLHYHRSGLISLDASKRLDRHSIRGSPLHQIGPNHKHCFSFVARHPFKWSNVQPRTTDLVFALNQLPTTVTIAGFVGPISNLKLDAQPLNPWAIMAEGDDGSVVPTVIARLEMDEPGYYVWVELRPDKPFGAGDDPALALYGLDPHSAVDHVSPTEIMAVWSVLPNDVPSER